MSTGQSKADVERTLGVSPGASSRRRIGLKWAIVATIAFVVVSMLLRWAKPDAVRFTTQKPRLGDLTVTVSATGTLAPVKEVEVGIEVSGTIESVEVDFNDEVKVGQVLARLDTSKLEAQVLQSKATLDAAASKVLQAEASVDESESKWGQLSRVHDLSGGKMPSQSDMDAAKAVLARARADLTNARAGAEQTRAALNIAENDLAKAVVHSPINGIVLTREIEPGQTVAATLAPPLLFTLAEDLREMELLVDIDEADVGAVRAGQDAIFTVDAYPEREFPARITQVRYGSETVEGVVTYKAVLRVDNTDLLLRPGMTATAIVTTKKVTNALLVPNAALRFAPPSNDDSGPKKRNLLQSLIPRPPQSGKKARSMEDEAASEQTVWILRDRELIPVSVTKGVSDGVMTEVSSGDVQPGMELVTDMEEGK